MVRAPLVCVVDDDESVRESLRASLRTVGYGVEAYASAEGFLSSVSASQANCLILDVRMPGMTGPELQRELIARHRRMPVVFITSHGDDNLRQQLLAQGAVACLRKPFTEEAVLAAVQAAIGSESSDI